ncbi:MAG: HEAT repeat domain-containing protein [Terriglobales bacterium]
MTPRNSFSRPWAGAALYLVLTLAAGAQAGLGTTANSDLAGILAALHAPTWQARAQALSALESLPPSEIARHPGEEDTIHLALIALLARENRAQNAANIAYNSAVARHETPKAEGEGAGEYFGELIGAVAGLRDARALPALIDDIQTGGMAADAVAAFGEASLPLLLKTLRAGSSGDSVCLGPRGPSCVQAMHADVIGTLARMCDPGIFNRLSPAGQASVRRALVAALHSSGSSTSTITVLGALQGLSLIHDTAIEPEIESLALHGDRVTRAQAIHALAAYHDPKTEPVLVAGTRSPDEVTRAWAVMALAQFRDAKLRALFSKLAAHDSSSTVRRYAKQALDALGGN